MVQHVMNLDSCFLLAYLWKQTSCGIPVKYPNNGIEKQTFDRPAEINQDYSPIFPILAEDFKICCERIIKNPHDSTSVRAAVWCYFSLVEAIISFMKKTTRILCEDNNFSGKLSPSDLDKLTKKYIKLGFIEKVKIVFKTLTKILDLEYPIVYTDIGWQYFIVAYHIRCWVTHPNRMEDLNISASDFKRLSISAKWFDALFKKTIRQIREKHPELPF